jgi:putative phosphotransacetylase
MRQMFDKMSRRIGNPYKTGILEKMEEAALRQLIQNMVLTTLAGQGAYYIPAAISARHVHLSHRDFETLFGKGAAMTRYRDLSQPGQFASGETLEVIGPKGSFKKVRVLGPERADTQVEISISDSFVLGIRPEIRMSGSITGTPGCSLLGPAGRVELGQGVIVAARHVHMSAEQASAYGVKDGDVISLRVPSPRRGIIGGIVVRSGKGHDLEVHLDTDEANGNGILCGTIFEMIKTQEGIYPPAAKKIPGGQAAEKALDLVTERDVNNAVQSGKTTLSVTAKGFISPAALDRAKVKGITIQRLA